MVDLLKWLSDAFEYEPSAKVQYKWLVQLLLGRGAPVRTIALLPGMISVKP